MVTDSKEIWINTGYEIFAEQGATGLKVEPLARKVGVSKSSFYHHFADLEIFIDRLMEKHLVQSQIIANKEKKAITINPELISILLEHTTDLLFNRQLRINSNIPIYKETLLKSSYIIGSDFIHLWLADTKLNLSVQQASAIFELALENFFLQINKDTLHQAWLEEYFGNLKRVTKNFESPLYGSV